MVVPDGGAFTPDFRGPGIVGHGATRFAAGIGGDARRRRASFESGRRDGSSVGRRADQRGRNQGPLRIEDWRRRYSGGHGGWIGAVLLRRRRDSRSKRGRRVVV